MQKPLQTNRIIGFALFLVLHVAAFAQTSLKEDMRLPWAQTQGGFLREWLMIGGFPNPGGKGYESDLLQEHQGEQGIKPVAGMAHKLSEGSVLAWKPYHSPYNYINFLNVLKDTDFYNKIAYAYTTVNWPQKEKAILSFGSNVGNKIWLNGKLVYENKSGRSARESHHLEVEMEKGENSILMKSIHGGWTWGYTMRLIKPESFTLIHDFQLSPSLSGSDQADELKIQTDKASNPEIRKIEVRIKAVAAGGKIVAEKTAKRGEEILFQTKNWPNGVYDIRFESLDHRGELVTAYLFWHKGDGLKAARELVAAAPKQPQTPAELTHAMLADLVGIDRLGHKPAAVDAIDVSRIYSPLLEYAEMKLQAAGKPGPLRANGFVRLAYRDEIDGTPQFCRAYLPLEYDAKKKWPLVLKLHGYNPANPMYIHWWAVDNRHYDIPDKYPVIYLEPHGRGNTGYQGIGELDVLRCIAMAKEYFNVDEDRIYLSGDSMGGGGTWYVGSRHPELFAAIAPIYGGWDYHVDQPETELARLTERKRFEFERNSSFAQAEALLTTPVFVLHGDVDKAVDVKHSRYAVQMLQRWGYDIRYHEFPYFGHEGLELMDEVFPWFLSKKRNAHPRTVRMRSAHLESASAHWLRVTQRDDPYAFVEAEAEALVHNTIRVFSENALAIELSPASPLIDPQKPVNIIWNGEVQQVRMASGKVELFAKGYQPAALAKKTHLAGPIADITTTPYALVIGTISEDSLMVKLCRQKAQEFIDDWKGWQKYEPRVFKDTELTEADMQKYSLILYGGANANLIAKKLSDKIPLQISANAVSIAGRRFEATDACVQMLYPHPLNPDRYVTIIGATSGAGLYFYSVRNRDVDFLIQDGCIANERQGRPSDKLYIARGIFDHNWQMSAKTLEIGDPELRKSAPIRKILPDLTPRVDNLPKIDPKIFEALAGTYEIQPGVNVSVFREGDRLMGKGPDGKTAQLYPTTETEYFLGDDDIQLSFEKDASGVVQRMVIHEGGRDTIARKIHTGTD